MSRKITLLPVAVICLTIALSLLQQPVLASGAYTTTTGVNVRAGASTSSNLLTSVSAGTTVDVLEHDPAGWSKVQTGNTVGYIRSDFLKISTGDTPVSMRTTAGVHVRAGASTSSNSLTSVGAGSSVDVLEHDPAGWSKVQVGSTVGYIRSDFLKHSGNAPDSSGTDSSSSADGSANQLKTTANVNMRSEASQSSDIIVVIAKDTTVGVLDESGGWSRVTHDDKTGYIRSDLLTQLPASSSSSQASSETLYTVGNVNLRKSASTEAGTFIRTLPKGTAVEVVEKGLDGWSKVKHNNTDGYIRSDLLTSSASGESQTRYTSGSDVRLRAKASTSSSILRTLPKKGTAVTVIADESNGWSSVSFDGTSGYIKSDLLSSSQAADDAVVGIMRVGDPAGANVRSGPSTSHDKIASALPFGTTVNVLSHESNGWSKVSLNGKTGYIKSSLLISGASVELVTMSEISHLLPVRQDIRIVDVRTGVSFNIKIFSKGVHADYEPSTRADTEAMFSTRNGVRSWSARPVWVYVGNRVFAASTHGMPHDVDWIKDNGSDGHLCLHFHNTTNSNISYRDDLRRACQEAYDKRPR